MHKAQKKLSQKLKGAERIAVLGIGSDLRGDDIAGISAAEQTEKILKSKKVNPQVKFFIGATAPENLTGEIKKFQPTHLLIIDSVYSKAKPGEIIVMEPGEMENVTFFTHKLPIKIMVDYLLGFFKYSVLIIGIQPKNINVGGSISKEVGAAVKKLSETIADIICQI